MGTDFSVTDKFARYRFFKNLELLYCVSLLSYHAGSQHGNIHYLDDTRGEE